MTQEQRLRNLELPTGCVDAILDNDAYNENDDQFAIAYFLRSQNKIRPQALYAAPFFNSNSTSAADGMEKSYQEIENILSLMGEKHKVLRGSDRFLADEKTPLISEAALDLVERAKQYSPEHPLYVIAIGAITNIASAILLDPIVAENTVVIWLGGHARHFHHTKEFNMREDIAAARVVMQSGVPFIQLPCQGVVSEFRISKPELEYWLKGKNALADYLATHAIEAAEKYASGKPWTRCIWDVTAVAWLLNEGDRFLYSEILPVRLPNYEGMYEDTPIDLPMRYVYFIHRDALMKDLIDKILR